VIGQARIGTAGEYFPGDGALPRGPSFKRSRYHRLPRGRKQAAS
jgi:hypothetical protein